jgi:pimeloyl-ACP methyl ester carboxylesterase
VGTGDDEVVLPDGRRVQLWQGGDRSGPAVVFFHGCPDSRRAAFSGDAAAREAGVRLIAVNRPGYGRSDPHPSGLRSVALDTSTVADLLQVGEFAVLGMSVGGLYALACAALHPARVTAAAVVAGPAVVPELEPPAHRDDLTGEQRSFLARLAGSTVEEAIAAVRPEFEQYVAGLDPADDDDTALAQRYVAGLHPQDQALLATQPDADLAAAAREALVRTDGYLRDAAMMFRPWEVRPEDVRCPTWLWYGEWDAQASVRNGAWLAAHVPGARLVVRPRTAHLAGLLEHWPEILTTLRDASLAGERLRGDL